jgi:hypothetical protein
MRKPSIILAAALFSIAMQPAMAQDTSMSFFITSVGSGDGGNLGGIAGADAHCQHLAGAAGQGGKTWHAYLSTSTENAGDRIGSGPWYNAKGVKVAENVADLHSENSKLGLENSLSEKGMTNNGRSDTPNQHDILTGSNLDGTRITGGEDLTCNNWTSNSAGKAQVGHHDRTGGGANPNSWNSAHASRGCSQADLVATGGNGHYYCFATR